MSDVFDYEGLVRDFLGFYEAKDINSIDRMLSDDVVIRDWNLEVQGKSNALDFFNKNFRDAESLSIEVRDVFLSESGAAVVVDILVNNVERLSVVDVVTFDRAGLVESVISFKGL